MQDMFGRNGGEYLETAFSISAFSEALTLTAALKRTRTGGSRAGFESILAYAECERDAGSDKARSHFFNSDIRAFGKSGGVKVINKSSHCTG